MNNLTDTLKDIASTRIDDEDVYQLAKRQVREIEERKTKRFWKTYANGAFQDKETDGEG